MSNKANDNKKYSKTVRVSGTAPFYKCYMDNYVMVKPGDRRCFLEDNLYHPVSGELIAPSGTEVSTTLCTLIAQAGLRCFKVYDLSGRPYTLSSIDASVLLGLQKALEPSCREKAKAIAFASESAEAGDYDALSRPYIDDILRDEFAYQILMRVFPYMTAVGISLEESDAFLNYTIRERLYKFVISKLFGKKQRVTEVSAIVGSDDGEERNIIDSVPSGDSIEDDLCAKAEAAAAYSEGIIECLSPCAEHSASAEKGLLCFMKNVLFEGSSRVATDHTAYVIRHSNTINDVAEFIEQYVLQETGFPLSDKAIAMLNACLKKKPTGKAYPDRSVTEWRNARLDVIYDANVLSVSEMRSLISIRAADHMKTIRYHNK